MLIRARPAGGGAGGEGGESRAREGRNTYEPLGEGVLSLDLPENAATVLLSCEEERRLRPTPEGVFLKEEELCPRCR